MKPWNHETVTITLAFVGLSRYIDLDHIKFATHNVHAMVPADTLLVHSMYSM